MRGDDEWAVVLAVLATVVFFIPTRWVPKALLDLLFPEDEDHEEEAPPGPS